MRELVLRRITRSEANNYPDVITLPSDEAVVLHRFSGDGRRSKGTINVKAVGQEVRIECTHGEIFVAAEESDYSKRHIEAGQTYSAEFGDNISLGTNGIYQVHEKL